MEGDLGLGNETPLPLRAFFLRVSPSYGLERFKLDNYAFHPFLIPLILLVPRREGRLIPSPVAPPICIRQAAKMGEKLSGKERRGEKIVVCGGGGQTGRDQIDNCTHSHPLSPRLINSLSSLMCQSIHRPVCRRRPRSAPVPDGKGEL